MTLGINSSYSSPLLPFGPLNLSKQPQPSETFVSTPEATASYGPAPAKVDFTAILRSSIEAFNKASTLEEIKTKGAQLPEMAKSMVSVDRSEVLGASPSAMLANFDVDPADPLAQPGRAQEVFEISGTILNELSRSVLANVKDGKFQDLNPARMSIERKNDAVAQHVGYTVGMMARDPKLPEHPDTEISRILLRKYFEGTLAESGPASPSNERELLAQELAKVAGGSPQVHDMVVSPDYDYCFSKDNFQKPDSLLSNLASVHAGEATLEFATHLFEGDEERAAAFLKTVFGRPNEDLQQLLKDPQGKEGLLLHFAAAAHHLSWEWAKMGSAYVAANQGDESALKKWNHSDIGPTRKVIVDKSDSGHKLADQIQSFLIRRGRLVPCERTSRTGEIPLSQLLSMVEKHGIYSDDSVNLRVVSPFASQVAERLHRDVQTAATLSDWKAGGELSANLVAHTCAAFAAQAIHADFQDRENLVKLYRDGISKFEPEVDKLLAHGVPSAKDEAYQALYQDLAGEFSFDTLKDNLGVSQAKELARSARFGRLIPIACEELRLPIKADFTPAHLVEDIAEMQKTVLKDDYFLSKPEFLQELRGEAQETLIPVNQTDLQNGVRIPNAMWMWTQLLRGLVEHKPQRYTAGKADFQSDSFPSAVQLNPPDTRDVELFAWARHRLKDHGYDPQKSTRMALALVVLTLHKDLLQIRKAA